MTTDSHGPPGTHVLFYIPNIVSYFRFFLLLLMLFNVRKRPFLSFIVCWMSGTIDGFDGALAGHYSQTSKFGYILDRGMDRLTTMAQMFTLTSIFPRHCIFFLLVGFVDLFKDFSCVVLNSFQFDFSLVTYLQRSQNASSITNKILDHMGQLSLDSATTATTIATEELNMNSVNENSLDIYNVLIYLFLRYIWYSSDVFYWLIYFVSFVRLKPSVSLASKEIHGVSHISAHKKSINELFEFFDNLSGFVEFYSKKNRLTSELMHRFNIKFVLRAIGLACLIGAVLKLYLNLEDLVRSCIQLAEIEDRLKSHDYQFSFGYKCG